MSSPPGSVLNPVLEALLVMKDAVFGHVEVSCVLESVAAYLFLSLVHSVRLDSLNDATHHSQPPRLAISMSM